MIVHLKHQLMLGLNLGIRVYTVITKQCRQFERRETYPPKLNELNTG